MLSKKDKEFLKQEIEDAVRKALTVKVKMERVRDIKTGQMLATPELIDEEVFLPSFITQLLPYYEQANRGAWEQLSKECNNIRQLENKVELIGNVIIQAENSLKALASISDRIKIENIKHEEIEYVDGEVSES